MLGKLSQLKWTSGGGSNRDLAFLIIFLAFAVILVMKLAPYYKSQERTVVYNKVQTMPSVPKSVLEQAAMPVTAKATDHPRGMGGAVSQNASKRPSILERPLFDGQTVVLLVRSLNSYSSNNSGQPIEAEIIKPAGKDIPDVDFNPAIGGKLTGAGSANLSGKLLNISFAELLSTDGKTYSVQGQAVSPNLTPGIEGDYSSGLTSRLAGIALDRTIEAADQIGTAYMFTAIGPTGVGADQLRTAAMQTNQQAAQSISGEATKGLRDTPAEIELPAGAVFLVRIRANQQGGAQ